MPTASAITPLEYGENRRTRATVIMRAQAMSCVLPPAAMTLGCRPVSRLVTHKHLL